MRSPSGIIRPLFYLSAVILSTGLLSANPRLPQPIRKVFYTDPKHWVVEFDIRELVYSDKLPGPLDITVGSGAENASSRPTMLECVKPVAINADSGIGLVTSEHVPKLELHPGNEVFVGIKGDNSGSTGALLPQNLLPNSTLELIITQTTCTEYIPGGSPVYDDSGKVTIPPPIVRTYNCTMRSYEVTKCSAGSAVRGRINGILTDMQKKPLSSFSIGCFTADKKQQVGAATTDGSGRFSIPNLDPCLMHILRINRSNFTEERSVPSLFNEKQYAIELPLQVIYPPTGIAQKKPLLDDKSAQVELLASSGNGGNPIVITVADDALQGSGMCELFSLSGEKLRVLPFSCRGVGTYTLAWEGCDSRGRTLPSATYLCRITIGAKPVCRRFIAR